MHCILGIIACSIGILLDLVTLLPIKKKPTLKTVIYHSASSILYLLVIVCFILQLQQ